MISAWMKISKISRRNQATAHCKLCRLEFQRPDLFVQAIEIVSAASGAITDRQVQLGNLQELVAGICEADSTAVIEIQGPFMRSANQPFGC